MAEFSSTARWIATILLIVLSMTAWRWMRPDSSSSSSTTSVSTQDNRKKTKKKAKKKATKKTIDEGKPSTSDEPSSVSSVAETPQTQAASESDDSDDEYAGMSARRVLSTRRFKPKAIGGATAVPAPLPAKYEAGQRILARFQQGDDWFPGVILEVRKGNQYHIKYDDGEIEYHVPLALIKDVVTDPDVTEEDERGPGGRNSEEDRVGSGSGSGDHNDDDSEDDDGWHVVSSNGPQRRRPAPAVSLETERVDSDGLTKRQRENRRKKERRKELKEIVRTQQQEQELHARWGGTRSKMTYVAPPTHHQ